MSSGHQTLDSAFKASLFLPPSLPVRCSNANYWREVFLENQFQIVFVLVYTTSTTSRLNVPDTLKLNYILCHWNDTNSDIKTNTDTNTTHKWKHRCKYARPDKHKHNQTYFVEGVCWFDLLGVLFFVIIYQFLFSLLLNVFMSFQSDLSSIPTNNNKNAKKSPISDINYIILKDLLVNWFLDLKIAFKEIQKTLVNCFLAPRC